MSRARLLAQLAQAQRVLVLGSSGAGKTRLSERLSRQLGLEIIHLDAHFWHPGWRHTPQAEWRQRVAGLAARPRWIMDGTYESSLDLRLPRADFVVYVDGNPVGCLWRVFKRTRLKPDAGRLDAPSGQKLDAAFFRYIWRFRKVTEPLVLAEVAKHGLTERMLRVAGPRDGVQLLAALAGQQDSVT